MSTTFFPPATHIDCTSCFTPVNKILPSVQLAFASEVLKMAPEPMDLSTPMKEENEAGDIQTPTPTPTPRKRGRPAKATTSAVRTPNFPTKGTTPKDTATEGDGEGDTNNEVSPSKKNKVKTNAKKAMGPIPTSYEAIGESDRLILRMRDEEGCAWPDITAAWMAITGITVGKTTLRMRYCTMKNNFVSVDTEDEPRLLKAKTEVEERFEVEKWAKIADQIVSDGGKKYPPATLQKKFKAMTSVAKAGAAAASPARGSLFNKPTLAGAGKANVNIGVEDEEA
ncbi:uncharacterized protein KD926_000376 [Aspergillus affinis]|uniref:uncharacterized protein n=1 Tax=Aspergillus affinis TaxID=1070780 RepID=UPI0022FDF4E2|nr:uncharacterized protein KD926_000376 [Aspergillus affinis]KAI9037413.1 hypothetical protein KD926_000376 [Aspergillus affinis]